MRVFVHIGAGKCGSSSIQSFLRINKLALVQQGFVVTSSDLTHDGAITGNQVGYFDEKLRGDPDEARAAFAHDIDAAAAAASDGAHTILLSAENLSNPGTWRKVFADVSPLSVVIYIRRQDDFLESAWQQWFSKAGLDIRAWLRSSSVGALGDWRASLRPWVEIAGRDAITVKRYAKGCLVRDDVVHDYAETVGIDWCSLVIPPPNNVTLNAGFGRLQQLSPVSPHDSSFYDLVCARTGARHAKRPEERLLSGEERAEILDRYAESNAWVRDNFFPELVDADEPLFRLSQHDLAAPAVAEEVIEQQMTAILRDLLVDLEVSESPAK